MRVCVNIDPLETSLEFEQMMAVLHFDGDKET